MLLRIGAIALAVLSLGATSAGSLQSQKQEKRPKPEVQVRGPIGQAPTPAIDLDEQYYIEQEKVAAYLAAIEQQREVNDYLNALYQEQLRQEAAKQVPPLRVVSTPTSGSGDCSAVADIVGWGTVQHESGGNPLAQNGIYKGCAQIGLPWWNGACSGLDWTNVADQATCAKIVMNLQGPSAWAGTYSR